MDDTDTTGAGTILGLLFLSFMLFAIFGLIHWIYKDAKQHQVSILSNKPYDSDAPRIWAFVCFLCVVIGAPYYFYRRAGVLALKTAANSNSSPTALNESNDDKTSSSQTANVLESQLKEVAYLKEKGLITEMELEQKRRKILGI